MSSSDQSGEGSSETFLDEGQKEEVWKLYIYRLPDSESPLLGQAVRLIAAHFGMTTIETRALLDSCPVSVPQMMGREEAEGLVGELRQVGLGVRCESVTLRMRCRCDFHPQFFNRGTCLHCGAWICDVCVSGTGKQICEPCHVTWKRRRTARRVRISVLLGILILVCSWAWMRQSRRAERIQWQRTLQIAVVVLVDGDVQPSALTALVEGMNRLEEQLKTEFGRYHERPMIPLRFQAVGPVELEVPAPVLPMVPSVWQIIEYTWEQRTFMRQVDERVGLFPRDFDSRIYVIVRPAESGGAERFVEGIAEWGGETGLVQVTLEKDTVDNALIAAAHETLHTLGATDKYEGSGRTIAPQGLAEPGRDPLYPQRWLEIMAKEIPVTLSVGKLPDSISQMRVGAMTAVEIGWVTKGTPEGN